MWAREIYGRIEHLRIDESAGSSVNDGKLRGRVLAQTVHTQLGVPWIATAWLATGLFIAPILSGHEPKLQKLGVDVLFWALRAIVAGSTALGWRAPADVRRAALWRITDDGVRLLAAGQRTAAY